MSEHTLDNIDRQILVILQGDLGDCPEPYTRIAKDLNISEEDVIRRIKKMKDNGIIRRFGAMIRHIEAGIGYNGMVVWKVSPDRVEEVGNKLASFPEVTHCYERPPFGEKGGTLFTMVHSESEQGCKDIVLKMAQSIGIKEYEILFSERELKKISMTYFNDDSDSE